MRFEGICICGYSTPIVGTPQEIDWDMIYAHQEFCEAHIESIKIIEGEEEE
jgi:hypothetical protein